LYNDDEKRGATFVIRLPFEQPSSQAPAPSD
jgi:hypothetical protein